MVAGAFPMFLRAISWESYRVSSRDLRSPGHRSSPALYLEEMCGNAGESCGSRGVVSEEADGMRKCEITSETSEQTVGDEYNSADLLAEIRQMFHDRAKGLPNQNKPEQH